MIKVRPRIFGRKFVDEDVVVVVIESDVVVDSDEDVDVVVVVLVEIMFGVQSSTLQPTSNE